MRKEPKAQSIFTMLSNDRGHCTKRKMKFYVLFFYLTRFMCYLRLISQFTALLHHSTELLTLVVM